jgi:hypothetical protein
MGKLNDEQLLAKIKELELEESFSSYVEKYKDKKVTEALKSYQGNQQKKGENDSEKIATLENELKELRQTLSKRDKDTLIENELSAQGLSKDLKKYISLGDVENPDKEAIAESVSSLKQDLLGIKQGEIDEKLKSSRGIPQKGDITGPGSGMETAVKEYAKKISPKE